ncbi:class D beta-lactamase [Rubritalea spongiae]|uniref:Beta-lactamase n=1 Tax=Rubritalea spongiae TaxID=430797 RepID=A0ABW5E451_9BACT
MLKIAGLGRLYSLKHGLMISIYRLLIVTLCLLPLHHMLAEDAIVSRPKWQKVFSKFAAEGTLVVLDEREETRGTFVFNKERAEKRFSPASTFKIPHALFALDAGVVRDEFQVIPWDGKKRRYEVWNRDQTLRSSMRHSVVWVYEVFEKEIGESLERAYMEKIDYGNADPTGDTPFWVEGNLRISALEQISFLQKLYRNELPFSVSTQRLVKDMMINEAGKEWILRAKTGWSGTIGWWVGWVELPTGAVFFALNIDTPNRADDLYKREAIVREVFQSLKVLP